MVRLELPPLPIEAGGIGIPGIDGSRHIGQPVHIGDILAIEPALEVLDQRSVVVLRALGDLSEVGDVFVGSPGPLG